MFNGYYHYDIALNDDVAELAPADSSDPQITRYILGDPARTNPQERTDTHDQHWANFIYSAVKLIEIGIVRPQPGDILTFMIYFPPYEFREEIDWDASPHNLQLHRNSPWVAGKDPYDPMVRLTVQGTMARPPLPRLPSKKTTQTIPSSGSPLEEKINHEILMRQTAELDRSGNWLPHGGFHKRARRRWDYTDSIVDIPYRIALGGRFGEYPPSPKAPPLEKVFIKLLFLRQVDDLYAYIVNGTWIGKRYYHLLETRDEEDMGNMIPITEASWFGLVNHKKRWHPAWLSVPAVNRNIVKIKRLDYFGHSADHDLFLQYGWSNKKGEVPKGEVIVPKAEFDSRLKKELFTNDSFAHLWGCNLGTGMASVIAKSVNRVRACRSWTSYDGILNSASSMPSPVDPTNFPWEEYIAP
jgi:hypothetical protein